MTISGTALPFVFGTHQPIVPSDATLRETAPAAVAELCELQFDLVETTDGLDDLAAGWNELFDRAGMAHHVFQTFGFASLWVTTVLGAAKAPSDCRCRLAIVTARRGDRLVLVWPLVITRQFGLRILSSLGEPIAQYSDALVDPAENAADVLTRAIADVSRRHAIDILRLRKVRADAAITPYLERLGATPFNRVEAPCVTLATGGSAFESRQSGKAKKNRRRLLRRLDEQGVVAFGGAAGSPDAACAVVEAIGLKRDWLKRRGHLSPAIADRRVATFFAAAASSDAGTTGCRVFTITLDQRLVAAAVGFACKRRLMLHLITQSADVERFGAGVLNLEAVLRAAEAEGFEAVDLLPPKADYKDDWADVSVAVADHAIGLTVTGRCWAFACDRTAKPHLKRALEALPFPIRRRIAMRALDG